MQCHVILCHWTFLVMVKQSFFHLPVHEFISDAHEVLDVLVQPGARFTNFQELFLTQILNAILNRL
jgi:hypothetical protein